MSLLYRVTEAVLTVSFLAPITMIIVKAVINQ